MGRSNEIRLKRVYHAVEQHDGLRVLVDRLWPRGLSREKAKVDLWEKDLAPTHELRRWFNHDPEKWLEFLKKYKKELQANQELVNDFRQTIKEKDVVTFLFAASDEAHNNAVALKRLLE